MENMKILLCEDERIVAAELQDRLQGLGHKVLGVASNGADAIRLAKQMRPDLALMDIRLEGAQSGIEVADIFRREFDLPSIYLTAYADKETIEKVSTTRPIGYLVKPVEDRELELAIKFGVELHRTERTLRDQISALRNLSDSLGANSSSEKDKIGESSALNIALKMEEMSGLIGGIAHHFNNSLTVLYGHLSMLLEGNTLNSFEQRQVKRALEACDTQKDVVRHLMCASCLAPRNLTMVSIQDVVRGALESAKHSLPQRISLNETFPEASLKAYIDRDAVALAVTEIVRNAEEAISGGGNIGVSVSSELEDHPERFNMSAKPGRYIMISVTDTGRGIPPEELTKIAEPFYTTHESNEFHGLGLTAAYGVARSHGGWLTLSSKVGEGTAARLFIPQVVGNDSIR